MLFKFHTCTLNRVYGYVRVQLVANSFEPLYSVQCTVQGQCPMYCTVSNVLYSAQCTVQCPITVQCPMYCTVCGEDD